MRYQLARAYQATGQGEQARAALEDYEAFRKAAGAELGRLPASPITAPR